MSFSDTLIIYLYSYFPAIMLGLFFWWMDRFERVSLFIVAFAFLWGAFGAGMLSYFWNTFFDIALQIYQKDSAVANDMLVGVMVAPFVEELTKGCVILALLKLGKIDNITDGILLGVLIGLGFAAGENVHYAIAVIYPSSGELATWHNLWFREIHTTLLHASATAVWGALIGYSRNLKGVQHYFSLINGFVLAMVTHGFWNFLASYVGSVTAEHNVLRMIMRGELFVIFGMLLTLFLVSVRNQSHVIISELMEECDKGIIPLEHVGFFASLVRHPKFYKLPKETAPHDYARLGVRLAFRKNDYRYNPTKRLLLEIENLRERLKKASEYTPDSLQLRYGR